MTIRTDETLRQALAERARAQGKTVSAYRTGDGRALRSVLEMN
jgi:hypothetical protein